MKALNLTGLTAFRNVFQRLLNGKQDKEAGKGLSSNNFTQEEYTNLTNAQTDLTTTATPTFNDVMVTGTVYGAQFR